jgi:hypothetical protein
VCTLFGVELENRYMAINIDETKRIYTNHTSIWVVPTKTRFSNTRIFRKLGIARLQHHYYDKLISVSNIPTKKVPEAEYLKREFQYDRLMLCGYMWNVHDKGTCCYKGKLKCEYFLWLVNKIGTRIINLNKLQFIMCNSLSPSTTLLFKLVNTGCPISTDTSFFLPSKT